jgi:hypothetical protein
MAPSSQELEPPQKPGRFIFFFGDRIEAFSKRLEDEEDGREERNRAWIEQQNSQAAQRDRIRKLANAEIERPWRIKQSR